MNVLSLNCGDLGGLSYNLCHAISKHTSHQALHCVTSRPFTLKPVMWHVTKAMKTRPQWYNAKIKQLVKNADVLHFNEFWRLIRAYRIKPSECKKKKVIFHAHGGVYRRRHKALNYRFKRFFPQVKFIMGTPDLLAFAPKGATWFPSIVPIQEYRAKYAIQHNKIPIIYYSPSQSSSVRMKRVIDDVAKSLQKEKLRFKVQKTTLTKHRVNMRRKSKADIYYDEIKPSPFYGVNAIEAGAFEMAVICNMNEFARKYMRKRRSCPFMLTATQKQLKQALRRLIKNKDFRLKKGKACYEYVKKMHSEKVCVNRFLALVQ